MQVKEQREFFELPEGFMSTVKSLPREGGFLVMYEHMGGAYTVKIWISREYQASLWNVYAEVHPDWFVRLCSFLLDKPLQRTEKWNFDLKHGFLDYLPEKIESFVQGLEWWLKY